MKRLLLLGSAVLASTALAPAAHAELISTDLVGGGGSRTVAADPAASMSTLNPILNQIPMLSGPDRRHICLISDQVDKSWCFYVAIP